MYNIDLLVGGRSTEHDASIHSYLGVIEDYLTNRFCKINIKRVF